MKEQFVTYEIALKLKELGFDEECLAIYYKDDEPKELLFSIPEKYSSNPEVAKYQARDAIRQINFDKGWAIKAPLWQQVIDWFRNNHLLNVEITPIWINSAIGLSTITGYLFYCNNHYYTEYQTYEEAREQAILKVIELCQK